MEKRFYLGVGILVIFLMAGLLVSWGMERLSDQTAALLEQAEGAILSGNLEAGEKLAQQAKQLWRRGWKAVAIVADHSPMDEIDELLAQMDYLTGSDDQLQLGEYCARMTQMVRAMADAHRLTWWNIL